MATIKITRQNGKVVFTPNPLTVGRADAAIFVNYDTQAAHWITGLDKTGKPLPQDAWMEFALGAYVEGQDPFTSPMLSLADQNKTGVQKISYVCSMHGGETGTIEIPKRS